MLSLHQQAGKLRRADNLIPFNDSMVSRPGAVQVVADPVSHASAWGERIIAQAGGRMVIWDGERHDVGPATDSLVVTSFQALTTNALREDRLYIANGVEPLFYLTYVSGEYVRSAVTNEVLDSNNKPYALPIPKTVTTWRNRLWIGDGTNRALHSQNDNPHEFDPLWTIECQGSAAGRITAMHGSNDRLLVGLNNSIWQVTGDSQFNFARDEIFKTGVSSQKGLLLDSGNIFWVSDKGVFFSGASQPFTADIFEAFESMVGIPQIAADPLRRLLLCYVSGRVFVTNLDSPGAFGEIVSDGSLAGVIKTDSSSGWYGSDGLWLLDEQDSPDKWLVQDDSTFVSRYDTWGMIPNTQGGGRDLLNRLRLVLNGSRRYPAQYELYVDGELCFEASVSLSDDLDKGWYEGDSWQSAPVHRELVPRAAGRVFRHVLWSKAQIGILGFEPEFRSQEE